MNREAAFTALWTYLGTRTPSFKTKSRRLRHWTDVSPPDMPALFMTQAAQQPVHPKGVPYHWIFNGSFYVYAHSEDLDVAPATVQNNLLDELELALKPDNLQRLNFGTNYVDQFRFEGAIETDEGLLGDLTVAIIPFMMIVT